MFRATLLITTALAAVAPAASASVTFTGDGATWAQAQHPATALPGDGIPVEVSLAKCPGLPNAGGCVIDSRIYLTAEPDRLVFMHELGHIYDARNLDDYERGALAPYLVPGKAWSDCGNVANLDATDGSEYGQCPKEVFADAYAACALKAIPEHYRRSGKHRRFVPASLNWPTGYRYMPSLTRQRIVCALIRAFGDPAV
jgi:hypothetical protein